MVAGNEAQRHRLYVHLNVTHDGVGRVRPFQVFDPLLRQFCIENFCGPDQQSEGQSTCDVPLTNHLQVFNLGGPDNRSSFYSLDKEGCDVTTNRCMIASDPFLPL